MEDSSPFSVIIFHSQHKRNRETVWQGRTLAGFLAHLQKERGAGGTKALIHKRDEPTDLRRKTFLFRST